jgi:hypothetical protein
MREDRAAVNTVLNDSKVRLAAFRRGSNPMARHRAMIRRLFSSRLPRFGSSLQPGDHRRTRSMQIEAIQAQNETMSYLNHVQSNS